MDVVTLVNEQESKESSKAGKSSPTRKRKLSTGTKGFTQTRTESPLSSAEDTSLSQKSDLRFSDDHERSQPLLKSSKSEQLIHDQSDLSQASKSSLPPYGTFVTHDESLSTQSSSDVNIHISPMHQSVEDHERVPPDFLSNEHMKDTEENGDDMLEEVQGQSEAREDDKSTLRLYTDFGDEIHKLNLKKVQEFLESCGETEPLDLSTLRHWDGWTMASREIM